MARLAHGKIETLEELLELSHLNAKEDPIISAIQDLKETAELWDFINGIRFTNEMLQEIE